MRMKLFLTLSLLALAITGAANSNSVRAMNAEAFTRLKSLVGEWEADTSMGKVRVTYELVAGGTALLERETGEKMPTMLTIYHLDGDRLLLTHYCALGNQPRMEAKSFRADTGELEFKFLDVTNLAAPGASHMHAAKMRLIDKDHFSAEWDLYENNQRKQAEKWQYTRVR